MLSGKNDSLSSISASICNEIGVKKELEEKRVQWYLRRENKKEPMPKWVRDSIHKCTF